MSHSPSLPRSRTWTIILLGFCALAAAGTVLLGVDDNSPGALLALLAAVAFLLVFAHPWRRARQFLYLLLASINGFIVFIITSILTDTLAQGPAAPAGLLKLLDSPLYNAVILVFIMLCQAALLVGTVGALVMFIRNRRHERKPSGRSSIK